MSPAGARDPAEAAMVCSHVVPGWPRICFCGERPAHIPPALSGNGRLDRNVCSLTMSPFSEAVFS